MNHIYFSHKKLAKFVFVLVLSKLQQCLVGVEVIPPGVLLIAEIEAVPGIVGAGEVFPLTEVGGSRHLGIVEIHLIPVHDTLLLVGKDILLPMEETKNLIEDPPTDLYENLNLKNNRY